jgi:hypothetical protein
MEAGSRLKCAASEVSSESTAGIVEPLLSYIVSQHKARTWTIVTAQTLSTVLLFSIQAGYTLCIVFDL